MIIDWGILKDTLIVMTGLSFGWFTSELITYFMKKRNKNKRYIPLKFTLSNFQLSEEAKNINYNVFFDWNNVQDKVICLNCKNKDNCYVFAFYPFDALFFIKNCDRYALDKLTKKI